MGQQIIRQPDGRLAVFSSNVDAWVMFDATADDLVAYYADEAAERARVETRRVVDKVLAGDARDVYYQWTLEFENADLISAEHGHRLRDLQAGIGTEIGIERAPWIPEQTLANHLQSDPPADWHEIDNLTPDKAREVAKLAIRRLREKP